MPVCLLLASIRQYRYNASWASIGEEMTDRTTGLDPAKGGLARAARLTPEQRREIAQTAAEARWANQPGRLPRATHEGPLLINGIEIPCAVLEDGTRVLSRIGFIRAIGRRGKAKGGRRYDREFQLPVFLTAENLKPFIPNELLENSKPIEYRTVRGQSAIGYRAELLSHVCNVFMDAKEQNALRANQLHIAESCKILSRGFSILGITALVDEATGYQEVRDRHLLQKILDAYLSRELAAWAKRFPTEFYKEMFRLREWPWDDLKNSKGQGPRVVGKYTNDLVYARLAPGILEELQVRNPMNERGQRPAKHHQWLTQDVGHPALAQHLHAVIGLMRASETWDQFLGLMKRAFPRKTKLSDLPLFSQGASTNGETLHHEQFADAVPE